MRAYHVSDGGHQVGVGTAPLQPSACLQPRRHAASAMKSRLTKGCNGNCVQDDGGR